MKYLTNEEFEKEMATTVYPTVLILSLSRRDIHLTKEQVKMFFDYTEKFLDERMKTYYQQYDVVSQYGALFSAVLLADMKVEESREFSERESAMLDKIETHIISIAKKFNRINEVEPFVIK